MFDQSKFLLMVYIRQRGLNTTAFRRTATGNSSVIFYEQPHIVHRIALTCSVAIDIVKICIYTLCDLIPGKDRSRNCNELIVFSRSAGFVTAAFTAET